jgi:hypothetical protein
LTGKQSSPSFLIGLDCSSLDPFTTSPKVAPSVVGLEEHRNPFAVEQAPILKTTQSVNAFTDGPRLPKHNLAFDRSMSELTHPIQRDHNNNARNLASLEEGLWRMSRSETTSEVANTTQSSVDQRRAPTLIGQRI